MQFSMHEFDTCTIETSACAYIQAQKRKEIQELQKSFVLKVRYYTPAHALSPECPWYCQTVSLNESIGSVDAFEIDLRSFS